MARYFLAAQGLFGILVSACTSTNAGGPAGAAETGAPEAGDEPQVDMAMKGTNYEPGRIFGQRYCSPCHSQNGQDPRQMAAYPAFHVDTYDDWATGRTIISAVLDKWNPDGTVMPPPGAVEPPDDERRLILAWVRRGSPNTSDGN